MSKSVSYHCGNIGIIALDQNVWCKQAFILKQEPGFVRFGNAMIIHSCVAVDLLTDTPREIVIGMAV